MLLGCIADDFTGASDLANTLTRGGMATIQFIGTPTFDAPAGCEAGVVALKIRSNQSTDAVAQSLDALSWLTRQGCTQFLYKYCSTFDSTPEGNIGPVMDHIDAAPIVYSTAEPAAVASTQMRHGREHVATVIESFFGDLAEQLASAGVCRIVVGGGETAGAVVTALGVRSFRIGPEIDPGVPVLEADGLKPMRLALKSGNFGAVDFYAKALRMMEAS